MEQGIKLCDKVITLRKEKGLSQEQLADYLGVSRQSVSKWEADQSTPSLDKIIQIADIFGVSVDYLVRENVTSEEKNKTVVTTLDDVSVMQQLDEIKHLMKQEDLYEYKSEKTLFGLPLVHVKVSRSGRPTVAKGILAVGTLAFGIFSLGIFSIGLFALGVISIGLLLSFGAVGIGGLTFGGVAIGVVAIGGLSIGIYSFGGAAIATNIAVGGYASGNIALGDEVRGAHQFHISDYDPAILKQTIKEQYPRIAKFILRFF